MRTRIGAVAAVAVVALVVFARSALSGPGGAGRPFKATLAGSSNFPLDSTCPVGRRTVSTATGTASHLGQITMVSNHCTPPGNVITQGQMTLIAANGDELHPTYAGTCDFDPLSPVGTIFPCHTPAAVVGGTGRFQRATGTAQTIALITFAGFGAPEWPGTWSWHGQLSY